MHRIRADEGQRPTPRPAHLAGMAWELYDGAAPWRRRVLSWRPFICPFDRLVELVPVGARVLDVGCGAGLFLGLLAAAGRRPDGLGFDSSGSAIETARGLQARLDHLGIAGRLRFDQRDADRPWPSGPFDVVALIDVMHHVPPSRQEALIASARQALAPGGTLLYKDIAPRPHWRAVANRLHDLVMAREWVHYRDADQVAAWGRDVGLRPRAAERIDRLLYGHQLLVFTRPDDGAASGTGPEEHG